MNINELQIGDYVRCKDRKEALRLLTVRGINIGDVSTVICLCMHSAYRDDIVHGTDVFDVRDLSPVPLTADILERSGFTREPMSMRCTIFKKDGGRIYLELKDPNEHEWLLAITRRFPTSARCELQMRVHYVHELQHAMRLLMFDDEIIAYDK